MSGGTGKNGQVAGYRIGGKTGTADKGQTGDVVVSFLCFAPADDPQVIMLLTMDTPSRSTGTYVSGGNMVAPTASTVMAEILPYLGVEPSYSAEELLGMDTTVPNVIGMSVEEAKTKLKDRALSYKIVATARPSPTRRRPSAPSSPVSPALSCTPARRSPRASAWCRISSARRPPRPTPPPRRQGC